ncbi:site-2 protease family protein [Phaeodactylibacter luteus]|uniref:Zinc metalloprotease n=1 Tax=Phaeodactylibacter luteus TaxID=1564516 RepID=A0A5C6S020_9BACT|nr:site-2 protease family protein [Phaeodactylibacter luteus]TXB67901.1 site-2 protease family protein [Phaeodactylibacter luteus]
MKGALQIARVFGIPVQVHWTFLLIFVWVLIKGLSEAWDWEAIGWMMAFVLAIFFCVVLHEFGHALTARRYGVQTRDIILSPIGGVARLDRLPDDPRHEFMVALAGPMVNLFISMLLAVQPVFISANGRSQLYNFFLSIFYPASNAFNIGLSGWDYFVFGLIFLNIILALFNMMPAFPMDGGRVLRALLSIRMGRLRATRLATYVGQAFAVAIVALGLWQLSIITAVVGIFVFVMAANEYKMVRFDRLLSTHKVADVVRRGFTPVYAWQPLGEVLDRMQHGAERSFLVFDQWHNLCGALSERTLVNLAKAKTTDRGKAVGEIAAVVSGGLLLYDALDEVYGKVYARQAGVLPVYEKGQLVGMVDEDGLRTFLKLMDK